MNHQTAIKTKTNMQSLQAKPKLFKNEVHAQNEQTISK